MFINNYTQNFAEGNYSQQLEGVVFEKIKKGSKVEKIMMEELRRCDTKTLLYLLLFKEKSKINPILDFWLDRVDEFEQVAWILEERLLHSNADLKLEGGN